MFAKSASLTLAVASFLALAPASDVDGVSTRTADPDIMLAVASFLAFASASDVDGVSTRTADPDIVLAVFPFRLPLWLVVSLVYDATSFHNNEMCAGSVSATGEW